MFRSCLYCWLGMTKYTWSTTLLPLWCRCDLEGGEWSAARPGHTLPPGKTRYPMYRRLGGPQVRSGWAENLAPTGIRSPDHPARSQLLYRLSYPAHMNIYIYFCLSINLFWETSMSCGYNITIITDIDFVLSEHVTPLWYNIKGFTNIRNYDFI
jgi:hypothetical protein